MQAKRLSKGYVTTVGSGLSSKLDGYYVILQNGNIVETDNEERNNSDANPNGSLIISTSDSPHITTTQDPSTEQGWVVEPSNSSLSGSAFPLIEERTAYSNSLKTTNALLDEMLGFEQAYRIRSAQFYKMYKQGIMQITPDFNRWARIYRALYMNEHESEQVEHFSQEGS